MASEPTRGRIPPAFNGIQVSCCKNPNCVNFAIPAEEFSRRTAAADPRYRLSGMSKNVAALCCRACGEFSTIKSNRAISEELDRMMRPMIPESPACCPDVECRNHSVPVGTPKHYHRWTTTKTSPRWRCLSCRKVFAVAECATLRQRDCELNEYVFRCLVNKVPMRRVAKILQISRGKVYDRIHTFAEQCERFAAAHERPLLAGKKLPKLRLQVDAQDYIVNWVHSDDTRNIQLQSLGSADSASGYVFGMHLDFDPDMDAQEIEADAAACGDKANDMQFAHRKHARVWLKSDYDASANRKKTRKNANNKALIRTRHGTLLKAVAAAYREKETREDVEVEQQHDEDSQLPIGGMQVHSEYVNYSHFQYLARLLTGAERVDFDMDQESGFRAAYVMAFAGRVKAGTSDAFYVRINKDFGNAEREAIVGDSFKLIRERQEREPAKSREDIERDLIRESMERMSSIGHWEDKWCEHPLPSKNEPEKAMCWLTEQVMGRPAYDIETQAEMYRVASMHAINRFFMQIRRSISLLERPIATASNRRRVWYGYSPYSPAVIMKMLTIFRTHYNYTFVGQDGLTPAQRFGLADRAYDENNIIDFHFTTYQRQAMVA